MNILQEKKLEAYLDRMNADATRGGYEKLLEGVKTQYEKDAPRKIILSGDKLARALSGKK